MDIPEEAIKATAMAICRVNYPDGERPFSDYMPDARAALEAAAPIIVAQALREEASRLAQIANYQPMYHLWRVVDDLRKNADTLEGK